MKRELSAAQAAVYDAVARCTQARFFVRIAREDDALWVCDLPRCDAAALPAVQQSLAALDVRCTVDERANLWRLDWTLERYERLVSALPDTPPALPLEQHLHDAYALCRLLLRHPAPLQHQPLAPLRHVLKCLMNDKRPMDCAALHRQAAQQLRRHCPCCHAAGRVLAYVLSDTKGE